ncbi:peptidase S8/S53 domain-containing protein [Lactarius quietus]|nr:peptidase S8/S53 domain-containing protein [Lactarius quietus]
MRYHWLSVLSFLIAAPLADFATPRNPWQVTRVKHTWHDVPADWESLGHPPAGTTIDLYIAFRPDRENALIDELYEISDPRHQRHAFIYVYLRTLPDMGHTYQKTRSLSLSGRTQRPSILSVPGSYTMGCILLHLDDTRWCLVEGHRRTRIPGRPTPQRIIPALPAYRDERHNNPHSWLCAPRGLHTQIQAVAPTTYFASSRMLQNTPRKYSVPAEAASGKLAKLLLSRDDEGLSPSFLRWLYDTSSYIPTATNQNKLGIVGFANQWPNRDDLRMFMNIYRADAIYATFDVVRVNDGGYDPRNPGIQASVDVQYASAMAYPTPLRYYSVGGLSEWSPINGEPGSGDMFLEWFRYILDQDEIPQTISISYGVLERDLPTGYAMALCDLFLQLGARGISVLVASGDKGVGCPVDSAGDGRFMPEFPASCPFVTSVGGTSYDVLRGEIAAPFSGGGFSNYFASPPYQSRSTAVRAYLEELGEEYAGLYNPAGRAYPDIAAQAYRFNVIVDNRDEFMLIGTGCSTPTVAGIISLLNDYRITMGRPPLGFLNIWLYGPWSKGFNDITFGSNPGCNTNGFPAKAGWDPVTGFGSPNFKDLQDTMPFV